MIVEDDVELRSLIRDVCRQFGHLIEEADNGVTALERHAQYPADLIVLDLNLPKLDGLGFLQALRPTDQVPVLVLTSRTAEQDRLKGFDLGADDYLGKPFSLLELLARINAVLRRTRPCLPQMRQRTGPFLIDRVQRLVFRDDETLPLTTHEFNVLEALMNHAGTPLSRNELLKLAWTAESRPSPRTVDVHLVNLRKKLIREGDPTWIRTSGGLGYIWSEPLNSVV